MKYTPLLSDTLLFIYSIHGFVPEKTCQSVDSYLGNWQEEDYSFLFFRMSADDFITDLISKSPGLLLVDQYSMTYGQWQGGAFKPFQLGCFLITPPGAECSPGSGQVSFVLDAGVVFGNGMHPTTRDCLLAIETACREWRIETMLDLGTGTGVLALAAAKLGVKRIAAVDYTLLAAQTAWRNVCLNKLTDTIVIVNGKAEELVCGATDLLVANIHYRVMKSIVASEGMGTHKKFILSGLLNREGAKIVRQLEARGASILKYWETDNAWQTILGSVVPTSR